MNPQTIPSRQACAGCLSLAWLVLGLGLLTACATTQKAPVTQKAAACAFLGSECNLLTPGSKEQAGLRYANPAAQWTQYHKIIIDPVTFWGGDSTQVPTSDQQTLVNYFHQQLQTQLGQKFEIVSQAGPGVMKLSVAIMDAEAATAGLRSVSMLIPQAHLLSSLKYMATGSYPFVGGAQAAGKVTDSATGQVLALAVDRQIGGGAFRAGMQWHWGDAENAINAWCAQTADRLSSWTSGAATP